MRLRMNSSTKVTLLAAALLTGACVTVPSGPSYMALPGRDRSFDEFRADDASCRQYASSQVGDMTPSAAATDSAVKSAAVGTVVGAAAGGAIGGSSGAATGAGAGLVVGALAGSGAAHASAYTVQQRYDIAYTQCMYAKGHKVPVAGGYTARRYRPYVPPPPPPWAPPPPPYY